MTKLRRSEEDKKKAVEMVKSGAHTKVAVAKMFGIPESTLRFWLKKSREKSKICNGADANSVETKMEIVSSDENNIVYNEVLLSEITIAEGNAVCEDFKKCLRDNIIKQANIRSQTYVTHHDVIRALEELKDLHFRVPIIEN